MAADSGDTSTVLTCEHCGNRSKMDVRAEYAEKLADVDEATNNFIAGYTTQWRLLQCPVCSKPTLQQRLWNTFELDYNDVPIVTTTILYPAASRRLVGLPTKVGKEYEAALKVRNISPPACAVLAGRTLEVLCTLEGAEGRTLVQRLDSLAKADKIPGPLAQMAQHLRQIRNLGAHPDEDEVTTEDVNVIIDFLEAILEYVYVAPARVAAVEARLKKDH